jgi:hypothetical protein
VDIESILNSLGLDLTNPEIKRGALEAIDAILDSRAPAMSMDGVTGGMSGEHDIELDPDLLQPSIKNTPQENDEDVEINDEEDVLKNIKHNDSEDSEQSPMSNQSETGKSDDESSDAEDPEDTTDSSASEDSSKPDTATEPTGTTNNTGEQDSEDEDESSDDASMTAEDTEKESDTDGESEEASDKEGQAAAPNEEHDDESDSESDSVDADLDDDELDQADASDEDSSEDTSELDSDASDEQETQEDEGEFDEDDLLDDNLKDTYEDKAEKAKHEARRLKRERTLQAAKKVLADAQAMKKAPALIRELEKAIEALEGLKEAVEKTLKDMSDEEFNLIVNRVFDAIDALGDSGITYTSDEERKTKAQEIKADLENRQTQAELSAEDVARIRAETQEIKAREKEKAKYQKRGRGSFKGFQDFLSSLYRAIALQVHVEETRDDTWSAINRRYSGTGVLQQGKKINELPNKKIPVIDFYFDQSGSWDESDIEVGKKAVEALVDMEEKGQIKINIYYFANHVHTDAESARNEGGTWAWDEIVKNVITTQATNVIIMTDSDMEDRYDYNGYWYGRQGKPASYTVPGYVWYLWRYGDNAPRLPRDLKGRGGTQQFSFNSGDL